MTDRTANDSRLISNVQKGNSFRDSVLAHLAAAGFAVTTETREEFKKADGRAVWVRDDVDGPVTYLVEMKDYAGALPLEECTKFCTEYGALVRGGRASRAWLISKGEISPDGRAQIEMDANLRCFSFQQFQRTLLRLDGYLLDLWAQYEDEEIHRYYVKPSTEDGEDLETIVRSWLLEDAPLPLAVISGYGKGKSTFAKHLAATMAADAFSDPLRRVPVLIRLGEMLDEVAIDSLLGKVFSSQHRAVNYHFHLFNELNKSGRFLIILDGFDEMKHGMTIGIFERAFTELMRFDTGDARVLILGRDTAFHNDLEFRSVILGKQRTSLDREIDARDRRPCRPVSLREFTKEEAASYVERYFPLRVAKRGEPLADAGWVSNRVQELLDDRFADLIVRPVHAQMLCEVATDPTLSLKHLSPLGLYDTFVHYLLEREVKKRGRDPAFPVEVRRRFNASVAWWLWEQGGASTASLDSMPDNLCHDAVGSLEHEYDSIGLKRELAAGLLVEKSTQTIYFAHRSIQEFLVAEHLLGRGLIGSRRDRGDPSAVLRLLNPEIISFLVSYFNETHDRRHIAQNWLGTLDSVRGRLRPKDLEIYLELAVLLDPPGAEFRRSDWMYWLGFFIRNGRTDFELRDFNALTVSHYLSLDANHVTSAIATVALLAHILIRNSGRVNELLPYLFAAWIPQRSLVAAVNDASKGTSQKIYVRREEDFALWAFLRSVNIRTTDRGVTLALSLGTLVETLATLVPHGFLFEVDETIFDGTHEMTCTAQALYRAMEDRDVPERAIDRLRPFFNSQSLRERIFPLVVERRSTAHFGGETHG